MAKERFPRSEHELLDFCADLREKNLSPHGITTGLHLDVLLDSLDAQVPTRIVPSRMVASHHGYVPSAAGIAQDRDARGGRHRKDIAQGLWSEGRTAMVRKLARLASGGARAAERAAQAQTQPGQVGTWTVRTERETWSFFGPESLVDGTVQRHSPDGWICCPRPGPFLCF